jgi:Fibronectin type III domain/FlgD Ig-like domain
VKTTLPNVATWTDTGLTKKTAYSYRVKAHNEMGDSVWSNISGDTTKDTKPTAPTLQSAAGVSYNAIDLVWTDNSDNEDGFRVERLSGTSWMTVGNALPNVTTFHDTVGLDPLTSYTYRVVAFNNGGDSPSNQVVGTTLTPPAPNAPTNLRANAVYEDEVELNWTDNSSIESGFYIERKVSGGNWNPSISLPANTTAYSDPTASPSTTYTYRVRAFNGGGNSGWSNEASATTPNSPPPSIESYLKEIKLDDDVLITTTGSGSTNATVYLSKRTVNTARVFITTSDSNIVAPPYVDVQPGQRSATFSVIVSGEMSEVSYIYGTRGNWSQRAPIISHSLASSANIAIVESKCLAQSRLVTWEPSSNLVINRTLSGYKVLRSIGQAPYTLLSTSLQPDRSYVDQDILPDGTSVRYMVQLIHRSGAVVSTMTSMPVITTNHTLQASADVIQENEFVTITGYNVPGNLNYHIVANNRIMFDALPVSSDGTVSAKLGKANLKHLGTPVSLRMISDTDENGFAVQTNTVSVPVPNGIGFSECDLLMDSDAKTLAGFRVEPTGNDQVVNFTVKNMSGAAVKQVSGYGHDVSWVWDGKDLSNLEVPEGEYELTVDQPTTSQSTKRKVYVSRPGVKFLVLYNTDVVKWGGLSSARYEATVRTQAAAICAKQPGLRLQFLLFNDSISYSDSSKRSLIEAFKKSQYFYYYGHGGVPGTPTSTKHSVPMGPYMIRNYGKWFYGSSTADGICIPYIAPSFLGQYKFIWIDACYSAGRDKKAPAPDYMTATPNHGWLDAFAMSEIGCSITWNGNMTGVCNGGAFSEEWLGQGTYREQLWIALGSGDYVSHALVFAKQHTPASGPWSGHKPAWDQVKQYGDGFVSLP